MSYEMKNITIGDGIQFTEIRDKKFKHNRISVCLIVPLSREEATVNALIPFLLRQGTAEYPTFTLLNKKLCSLYGAALDVGVDKSGQYQMLSLAVTGIGDRYALGGENMARECAQLLCQVLLHPHFVGDGFDPKPVELEKQFLRDTIEAEINDKRTYAVSRCKGLMCAGQPSAVKRYGYAEDVQAITPRSAAAAYRRILDTARIEFIFAGCADSAQAAEAVSKAFAGRQRHPIPAIEKLPYQPAPASLREETEAMDVVQGKLVLGFRVKEPASSQDMAALRLAVSLYGGTPFSLLFKNVREKMSLCYYCAARLDRATGILMVDSGVEMENKQKAQAAILEQLCALQEGRFTDEELAHTKLILNTSLKATTDSLSAMEAWRMGQILNGTNDSPEEDFALLERVTREDVKRAAAGIALDTVYFLTGKDRSETV